MKKFLLCLFTALCGLACQPSVEVDDRLSPLELSFGDSKYMIGFGETFEIEFLVSGIDGADVTAEVSFLSHEWEASCSLDAASGKGVLTITAPEKVGVTTAIVTVSDQANDRQVQKNIALASSASGFGELTVVFAQPSYTIVTGGEPVEVDYTVQNIGATVLDVPTEQDIETRLTVNSITFDPETNSGKIVVAATESMLAGTVSLTFNVSDNFGRKGSSTLDFTVTSDSDMPVSYNCYIVKPGSTVAFSSKFKSVTAVELAWQDAKSLITGLAIANNEITVTAGAGLAGNAMVLGKNSDGEILWSWHIWVSDFDPESTAVTVDGVTFMDRNLGAVTSAVGDVGAIGNAYQWGRKDPVPRMVTLDKIANASTLVVYDINNSPVVNITNKDPYPFILAETANEGTDVMTTIGSPQYFVARNNTTRAWWPTAANFKDYWGGESGVKSIYDPCPQGWKVPVITKGTNGAEANPYTFMTTSQAVWNAEACGYLYTKTESEKLWFPTTGQRARSNGMMGTMVTQGCYWMGSYVGKSGNYEVCAHMSFSATDLKLNEKASGATDMFGSIGSAVRCVKE